MNIPNDLVYEGSIEKRPLINDPQEKILKLTFEEFEKYNIKFNYVYDYIFEKIKISQEN